MASAWGICSFPVILFPAATTDRFALFACPWDVTSADGIRLVAADDAGNEAAMPFVDRFTPRAFPPETIPVSDTILRTGRPRHRP